MRGIRMIVRTVMSMVVATAYAILPPVSSATFGVEGAPAAMLTRMRPAAISLLTGRMKINDIRQNWNENKIRHNRRENETSILHRRQ